MHVGGGSANVVVRADEPSGAGHGVGPVIVAPGATVGRVGAAVVLGEVVVLDAALLVSFLDRKMLVTARTITTKTAIPPIRRMLFRRLVRAWAILASSSRCARPAFCRSRFAVPMAWTT